MDQMAITHPVTQEEKKRNVCIAAGSTGFFLLLGLWGATQSVAADCEYSQLLGRYISCHGWHIYSPFMYLVWQVRLSEAIPDILAAAEIWLYGGVIIGFVAAVAYIKSTQPLITHGSARWASRKDIVKAGLTDNTGVILGLNPYTHKLMRDDGPTHVFLMAPTRSGKGVCVIIPTLLTWTHSVFVTDVKGENWEKSAGYRRTVMNQKCIKFAPLEADGSSARWNPLAEIRMKTIKEGSDVDTIAGMLVDPYGANKAGDYWPQAGKVLLKGAILHHLYWYEKEGRPLPNLTNILTFLSNIKEALPSMATEPHITVQEFMKDRNIFQECYGDAYITDFTPFNAAFKELFNEDVHITSLPQLKKLIASHPVRGGKEERCEKALAEAQAVYEAALKEAQDAEMEQQTVAEAVEEYNAAVAEAKAEADAAATEEEREEANRNVVELIKELELNEQESNKLARKAGQLAEKAEEAQQRFEDLQQKYGHADVAIDFAADPWISLLVHPKVRECAMSMLDKAQAEMSGVQSTVLTALNLYQDPIVQMNTSVSDFRVKDLLEPDQAVSFFLIIPPNDLHTLTPLVRLMVNMMFNKLIREMKDEHVKGCKRQRLLLLFDEFPQFGKFETVDKAMAVCASYGIKMCIVSQNIRQLNEAYGKNQSLMANCHTQVYFTPNLDGGETAEALSKQLGKTTIKSTSRNDGGGGMFKGSNTINAMARDLMTPDEVARFPFEREIVMTARNNPIYGEKLLYYKDKRFVRRSYSADHPYYPMPRISDIYTQIDSFARLHEVQRPEVEELNAAKQDVLEELEKRKEAMWSVSKPTGDQMSAKEQEDEARAKGAAPENKKAYAYDAEKGWYKPVDEAADPGKVAC